MPAFYEKVLESMSYYYVFDVDVGSVLLTEPPQLQGKKAAVLYAKGTLTFAKPSSPLSHDQWHQFFTNFEVIQ